MVTRPLLVRGLRAKPLALDLRRGLAEAGGVSELSFSTTIVLRRKDKTDVRRNIENAEYGEYALYAKRLSVS